MTIGTPQPFRGGQGIVDWLLVLTLVAVVTAVTYWSLS